MKNVTKNYLYLIASLLFLLVFSCHPTFYIKITDISDPTHPCFSISQSKILPFSKGMWNMLEITEVDEKGNRLKPVWIIEPIEEVDVKELCYGNIPDGYKQLIEASPLEMNKFYLFYPGNMGCYFRISQEMNDLKVDIYTMSEFYEEVVNKRKLDMKRT